MKLRRTLNYQFTNPRCAVIQITMKLVTFETKRPFALIGAFAALFAAFVILLLRALPGARRPFDYLVAGTFATALALVVVFLMVVRRQP